MDIKTKIQNLLPYSPPFLFVDGIDSISEDGVEGHYTFRKDEYFYAGHFVDKPITPGVILIETMAQIGLVPLGIYLTKSHQITQNTACVFTSSQVEFLEIVRPGEKVRVRSEKKYFRMNKLKCKVVMTDSLKRTVCKGELAGIMMRKPLIIDNGK